MSSIYCTNILHLLFQQRLNSSSIYEIIREVLTHIDHPCLTEALINVDEECRTESLTNLCCHSISPYTDTEIQASQVPQSSYVQVIDTASWFC